MLFAMKSIKSVKNSISVSVLFEILQKNKMLGCSRRVWRTSCIHRNNKRLSKAAVRPAASDTGRYCSGLIIFPSLSVIREKHS